MLRMPQSLFDAAGCRSGVNVLEVELLAEQASALGQAGSAVQRALDLLGTLAPDDPARPAQVMAAARAVHAYLIQLELSGLHHCGSYAGIVAGLAIPREVMAKVGVRG